MINFYCKRWSCFTEIFQDMTLTNPKFYQISCSFNEINMKSFHYIISIPMISIKLSSCYCHMFIFSRIFSVSTYLPMPIGRDKVLMYEICTLWKWWESLRKKLRHLQVPFLLGSGRKQELVQFHSTAQYKREEGYIKLNQNVEPVFSGTIIITTSSKSLQSPWLHRDTKRTWNESCTASRTDMSRSSLDKHHVYGAWFQKGLAIWNLGGGFGDCHI